MSVRYCSLPLSPLSLYLSLCLCFLSLFLSSPSLLLSLSQKHTASFPSFLPLSFSLSLSFSISFSLSFSLCLSLFLLSPSLPSHSPSLLLSLPNLPFLSVSPHTLTFPLLSLSEKTCPSLSSFGRRYAAESCVLPLSHTRVFCLPRRQGQAFSDTSRNINIPLPHACGARCHLRRWR